MVVQMRYFRYFAVGLIGACAGAALYNGIDAVHNYGGGLDDLTLKGAVVLVALMAVCGYAVQLALSVWARRGK
uniref:Uncharacterized protein n=1 Tax=uncultured Latescibacterota bacterium TaxID=199737 RepID=Q2YZV4_9BACT|nr:hypothetical protein [uncultured Latescibacterota bacterium]